MEDDAELKLTPTHDDFPEDDGVGEMQGKLKEPAPKRMSILNLFGSKNKQPAKKVDINASPLSDPGTPYTPAFAIETPRTLFFNESKTLIKNMPTHPEKEWGDEVVKDNRGRAQSMWLGEKKRENANELARYKTEAADREREAIMAAEMGQMLIQRQTELEKDSKRTQSELLDQLKVVREDLDSTRALLHAVKIEKQQLSIALEEKDYEGSFKDQDLAAAAEEAERLKQVMKRKSLANFNNRAAVDNSAFRLDELEDENVILKEDLAKLRMRATERDQVMKDMQMELDALNPAKYQQEIMQLRTEAMKASTLQSRNKTLKEQVDNLTSELNSLKGEMGEVEALKKALDDKEKEFEKLQELVKFEREVSAELRAVIDSLEQERFESNFRSLGSDLNDQQRVKLLEEQLEIVTKERDRLLKENKKNAGAYDKLKQLEKFVEEDLEKIKRNMLELHADGLKAVERPKWIPDKQVKVCHLCKKDFGALNRKHHCRHCGKVACARCTAQKIAIKRLQYEEPVRVCYSCYFLLSHSTLLPGSIKVCPELCTAAGAGLEHGYQSRTTMRHFIITAVDEEGRAKTTGGDEFIVMYRHENDLYDKERPIKDNNDGTYDAAYLASKAGDYVISVFLNEEHIKGSPWGLRIVEPPPGEGSGSGAVMDEEKVVSRKASGRSLKGSVDGPQDDTGGEKKKWFARKKQ